MPKIVKYLFTMCAFLAAAFVYASPAAAASAKKKTPAKRVICLRGPRGSILRAISVGGKVSRNLRRYRVIKCPARKPAISPAPKATPQQQPNSPDTAVKPAPQKPGDAGTAIPLLSLWESQMAEFGAKLCSDLKNMSRSQDDLLKDTYYDAEWVFYQMADYTEDHSTWNDCAQAAEAIYQDRYADPNNGSATGYWNFTHGLTQDYLRTGDAASKTSALNLAHNAAFARDGTGLDQTAGQDASREVAYAIHAYLNEELLGQPRRGRLQQLVDQALGHIDQWSGSKTAAWVRPFMVGLTAHALIDWHAVSNDPRVLPAVKQVLDYIWDNTWIADQGAFRYTDRSIGNPDDMNPSPDLNLLIAPAFAWVYLQTGDTKYRDRGDQVFAGGVRNAWLNGGKQFNQSYRWSFDYVKWRKAR